MRAFSTRSCLSLALLAGTCGMISPASALDTVLENVTVKDSSTAVLLLGRVEVTGANLTQEELTKLFAEGTPGDERRALAAKLKADKLAIPSAVLTNKGSKITISKIFATNIANGKVEHAGLSGIDGANTDDTGGVGTIKSGPIVLDGSNLSSLLGAPSGTLSFTHLGLEDLAITSPDKDTPATAVGGNMFNVKVGTLSVDSQFDGNVLLKSAIGLKKLSIQAPPSSQTGQQFAAAGYDKLDLGLDYASTYDPATRVLSLEGLTISGAGAGSLQLKARLGGIDKSLMSGAAMDNLASLMTGNVVSADVGYVDSGLVEKSVGYFATQQQKSPAALRAETAAMARQLIPMLLGGAPNALSIAETVAAFVTAPTTLTVAMKPKTGSVGFLELMQIDSPSSFLEKIDVDVRAAGVAAAPAALAAPAAAPAGKAAPAARTLKGLEAWAALTGNTIGGKDTDGQPLFEYYTKDGKVMQLDDDETATGTWTIEAGKVCFEFPDDDEATCYGVTVDGNTATFIDDDGKGKRYEILPGNPKKL
ncbi:MAG: hypothetical protein JWM36_591 [Hyphomicrobiales bacterium]|nr:hypothetical protein [Hyphomicrobiales bacterium]